MARKSINVNNPISPLNKTTFATITGGLNSTARVKTAINRTKKR